MEMYNLELTFDEAITLAAALGLYHKELAKSFYEGLEGLKEDPLSIDEFDNQHKMVIGLYDKFKALNLGDNDK